MNERWVKEYKKITNWGWYKNLATCHLFRHLILVAQWRPGPHRGVWLETGQALTGRHLLAQETGLSEQQIRTALSNLKKTGEITIESTKAFSVITVCNYSEYQAVRKDEQPAIQPTINQQSTNNQPTINHMQDVLDIQTSRHSDIQTILPAAVGTAPGAPVEKKKRIPKPKTETPSKSGPTWRAYSAAYELRYKIAPVTNAKSYTLCAKLVDAVGATDAPFVAEWYVHSSNAFYAQSGHALSLLVRDAEKLRTEWATGQAINRQRIMDDERRQSNGDVWRSVMEKHGDEPQPAERIDYAKMFDFKNCGDVRDDNESGNE